MNATDIISAMEATERERLVLMRLAKTAQTAVSLSTPTMSKREAVGLLRGLERRNLVQVVDGRDRRRPDELLYELHPLFLESSQSGLMAAHLPKVFP